MNYPDPLLRRVCYKHNITCWDTLKEVTSQDVFKNSKTGTTGDTGMAMPTENSEKR